MSHLKLLQQALKKAVANRINLSLGSDAEVNGAIH